MEGLRVKYMNLSLYVTMHLKSGKSHLIVQNFVSRECYFLSGKKLQPVKFNGFLWEMKRNEKPLEMADRRYFNTVCSYMKTITKWV
jgi:hypothetical protein